MLTDIVIQPEAATPVINISPSDISISDWKAVSALGPFGNNNPSPKFFIDTHILSPEINPMGKEGKHSYIVVNNKRLLAFNTPARDVAEMITRRGVKGWIYHPRLDYWRNEEQLQFILDCAVTDATKGGD